MHAGRPGTDRAGEVRAHPLHPAEVQPNLRRRTGVEWMPTHGGSNALLHTGMHDASIAPLHLQSRQQHYFSCMRVHCFTHIPGAAGFLVTIL